MSTKTETEWDADYQPIVPHFDDSLSIEKGAVTADMIDSTYEPVQVYCNAFYKCFHQAYSDIVRLPVSTKVMLRSKIDVNVNHCT